jgi:hypothetical protein
MSWPRYDDELADWISRRERFRRRACVAGGVGLTLSGVLVLLGDEYLVAPAIPLVVAMVWWVGVWLGDAWYSVRASLTGHPVVRAELAWAVAADRLTPLGWYEAPVSGALHRTPQGWVWRPSSLVAADLPVLGWREEDVAVSTITPLWGPALPPSAQLRLYVRGSGTVEFIVWHPDRLIPSSWVGSALTS